MTFTDYGPASEPVGWDGHGSPLYPHQVVMHECPDCRSLYVSAAAARECCGRWDGRGWD